MQNPTTRNAVVELARELSRPALARLLGLRGAAPSTTHLVRHVAAAYACDLAGFLNRTVREDLDQLAAHWSVSDEGSIGELRFHLWHVGAEREAGGEALIGTGVQPAPILLRGKLVYLGACDGLAPVVAAYPMAIAEPAAIVEPVEPASLEQLLANADALIGVRLGARGRDKGAHGTRIAALLGVPELGYSEPDWRGEVEIKTVPVVRDRSGFWRVKEDPAIGMVGTRPMDKLCRVLWIARVADDPTSPILSWFYQERGAVEPLVVRYLHTRPKGGAGATTRGWYLHKRFFIESGFLRSLNG